MPVASQVSVLSTSLKRTNIVLYSFRFYPLSFEVLWKTRDQSTVVPWEWEDWFVISRLRYNEFVEKQQKCSLYRGIVNNPAVIEPVMRG